MNWLWWLVGWTVLFWGLRYGLTVAMLMRARFGRMSGSVVTEDRVPVYVRDLLEISALQLSQLGFRDCGYLEYAPFHRIHPAVRWMRVLVDESGCHFATIELRYPVAATDPFSVGFYTWFADGHLLLTLDRLAHAILDSFPNTTLGDNRIHNLARQWDYHQQQFATIADRSVVRNIDSTNFCDRYLNHFSDYFDRLITRKLLLPAGEDLLYKQQLNTSFRFAYHLIHRRPKPQPLLQPIDLPSEIAIDNSRLLEQVNTSTPNRRSKFWFFGLSMVAFYAATIPYMGWEFGLQLLFIILLHELGHLLAMQFFGYRNTSMLFIPFFGGVAMGKNENATLSQKFWIMILGPLPGILLGMVMLFGSHGNASLSWWHSFGLWMVGINLLNLLPIYPLDGGKIVSLLLQPYPYIGVGFKLICTILSIWLGYFGAQVFIFIGVAIALSLPLDLRTARAISQLKKQTAPPGLDKDEWFQWAYSHLARSAQAPAKPAQQKLFTNNLWEWKSDRHHPRRLRWGLGILYAMTLIGGTIGSAYGLVGNKLPTIAGSFVDDFHTQKMNPSQRQTYYRSKWQQDLKLATAAIDRDPNDVNAYRQRLRLHRLLNNDLGSIQDLDRLIAIDPHNSQHLYARFYLHKKLQNYHAALLDTDRIIQIDPKSKSHIHHQRGEIYTQLGDAELAIVSYSKHIVESPSSSSLAYLERGRLYAKKGERKLALADLDLAIANEPEYAYAYKERAKLREQFGDRSGAQLDLQTAAAIYAKNREDDGESDPE
jgi:tetratricopeptide (TPR) repeat protein